MTCIDQMITLADHAPLPTPRSVRVKAAKREPAAKPCPRGWVQQMVALASMPKPKQRTKVCGTTAARAKPIAKVPDTAIEREARELRAGGRGVWPHSALRATAYHEAGHALACVELGAAITSATIDGEPKVWRAKVDAETTLRITVAGGLAEAFAVGHCEVHERYSSKDVADIDAALRVLEGGTPRPWDQSKHYQSAVRWSDMLVRSQRDDLDRIAYLLSQHRTISGRCVALACGRTP